MILVKDSFKMSAGVIEMSQYARNIYYTYVLVKLPDVTRTDESWKVEKNNGTYVREA